MTDEMRETSAVERLRETVRCGREMRIQKKYRKCIEKAIAEIPDGWCPTPLPGGRPSTSLLPPGRLPIDEILEPPKEVGPDYFRQFVVITYFLMEGTLRAKLFADLRIVPPVYPGRLLPPITEGPYVSLRFGHPLEIWDGYARFHTFGLGVSVYEAKFSTLPMSSWIALAEGVLDEIENDAGTSSGIPSDALIAQTQEAFESEFYELLAVLGYADSCFERIQHFRRGGLAHWFLDNSQDSHGTSECWGENAICILSGYGYRECHKYALRRTNGSVVYVSEASDGTLYEEVLDATTNQYGPATTPYDESSLIHADNGSLVTVGQHHNWHNYSVTSVRIKEAAIRKVRGMQFVVP